jgi:predicted site-specific integrase-resolvase
MTKLLNTDEAAPLVGVEPKTLANWRCIGTGPAFIRAGRKIVYDPTDIEKWKAANRLNSTAEAA